MTKNKFWIVVDIEENGKYYPYAIPVTSGDNLVCVLARVPNSKSANVFSTKKEARAVVECWRNSHIANGDYLFGDTPF